MNKELNNLMRESRLENHAVEVKKTEFPLFENECDLRVTHNGYQWQSISLIKEEAIMCVEKLTEHFNL